MQPGGHRTTTQARQSVSASSPSPVLSSAVLSRTGVGCTYLPRATKGSPLQTFVKLSLSPVFSTRCALLLRSFALSKSSTVLFSYNYELFDKNTGGAGAGCRPVRAPNRRRSPLRTGGTPSANSNTLRDLCAPSALPVFSISGPRSVFEISNFAFSIASTFRMNTYESASVTIFRMNTYKKGGRGWGHIARQIYLRSTKPFWNASRS